MTDPPTLYTTKQLADAATRSELKRHGWRWSPQHTAWQRHLNNSTLYNLTQLFPALKAS